jgi:hypothetical protein
MLENRSGPAVDLSPPPAHAHKQKTPVVKELRRLTLERVPHKLENPSDEEQRQRIQPQRVEEDAGNKKRARQQNSRNAQRVTHPVHWMPMTGAVLRDPLLARTMLVSASAQHAEDNITIRTGKKSSKRNSMRSASTDLSQRKHKNTSRPRQFAQPYKGPKNSKASPDLNENFPSYKPRFR